MPHADWTALVHWSFWEQTYQHSWENRKTHFCNVLHSLFLTAPVIPCVVSQWSAWSGCAEPCKTTYRVRRRHVIQEPQNGGETCPALEERAGCVEYWTEQGTECKQSLSKSSENVSASVTEKGLFGPADLVFI